ncbi:MAG: DUF3820 family protein [Flammeovirgaceae bacterium]|nr:DUF3820 family protein [Flammeovirgaceae bacterium]
MEDNILNPKFLKKTANTVMPYGKYKGRLLIHLPEPYLLWFHQKGFPKGQLGNMLATIYEVKLNGLEHLIRPLITR